MREGERQANTPTDGDGEKERQTDRERDRDREIVERGGKTGQHTDRW